MKTMHATTQISMAVSALANGMVLETPYGGVIQSIFTAYIEMDTKLTNTDIDEHK